MTAFSSAAFDLWKTKALSVPIQDELARRGIRLRGKIERAGPCPKCGGNDRFSINTAKQLFNCRHCGVGGNVIDLVCHLDGADFKTACATLTGEPPPNGRDAFTPEPKEILTAKCIYRDEAGTPLFAVGRYGYQNQDGSFVVKSGKRKKTFKQKRPDPSNPGKSIGNVEGSRIVPYRLPELVEAIGNNHPILIVEGEAKVDLLRTWNVPATCNAMGAILITFRTFSGRVSAAANMRFIWCPLATLIGRVFGSNGSKSGSNSRTDYNQRLEFAPDLRCSGTVCLTVARDG